MVLYMIQQAEKRGDVKPGVTIIEATTGNTGIALAMIATTKGYKMIAVMPENMSIERRLIIESFGGKIILTPANLGPKGAIIIRNKLARHIKNSWILGQFENIDNIKAHQLSTAREIIRDINGKNRCFCYWSRDGWNFNRGS
jgi:cysteine synthase A